MRCLVCDKNEWENVDQYRNKKEGMAICKSCGFISYPEKWQSKDKILDYYRKEYRPAPNVENLYQGQRKLHYHHEFLNEPILEKWKKEGKKDPAIFEIGSAYGLVLAWFKNMGDANGKFFPNADVCGTELTQTYKRNAYHEFGLELKDDFDESKQYDLIFSYKVAEHMLDADLELLRYRKALKPDGALYISVPTWFNRLHNFGGGGFSIEYYYSPNHINVWSREHFEYVLAKAGFKIVKENHSYYDNTYLCVPRTEKDTFATTVLPTVEQIKDALKRVQIADDLCQKKMFKEALEQWPNFPIARRALYEFQRKDYHEKGFEAVIEEIVKPWIAIDPYSHEAYSLGADVYMRYDRYDEALNYLKEALARRPKCDILLAAIANCYRMLAKKCKDQEKKVYFMKQSRDVMRFMKDSCLNNFGNAVTWIYNDNAHIPTPFEGDPLCHSSPQAQ